MLIFSLHYRSFFKRVLRAAARVPRRGFTLIEMLVVASIIMILTGLFLFQQSRFDSSTILRGLAYSTALSVRQAQVYGTSVLRSASGAVFAPAYGLYISPGSQYILFADQSGNGYTAGEEVKTFKLGANYSISKICAHTSTVWRCSTASTANLQIIFKRPNPDAEFTFVASGVPAGEDYSSAYMQVISSEGTYRNVWVNSTGQVRVLPPNEDPT